MLGGASLPARKAGADEEKEANTPFAGENAKNL
jgi:hypothetical protein